MSRDPRHPRPRRRRRPHRRDRRDVRRPDRREGARPRTLFAEHEDALHRGAARRASRSSRTPPHTRLRDDPGPPARPRQPAAGCRVRAALPVRPRPLPRRGAAARSPPTTPTTCTPAGTRSARPSTASGARSSTSRAPARRAGRCLMAGTGKAHLPRRRRHRAARRGPRRRVPGRPHRARRSTPSPGSASTCRRGETLGLVGESGCGKTHHRPGDHAAAAARRRARCGSRAASSPRSAAKQMREARTRMQMIFQDPISSLNPRRKVRDIVMEPLTIWKRGHRATSAARVVDRTLEEVGIDPARAAESQPHQFSGGQCQRISIARSLVLDPTLIICDEPVSALDVSVQAQVLNLLEDLKARARADADLHRPRPRRGEEHQRPGRRDVPRQAVRGRPERRAVPRRRRTRTRTCCWRRSRCPTRRRPATPRRRRSTGEPPSPVLPPTGCRFHTRCPAATDECATDEPQLRAIGDDHFVACHHPRSVPVAVTPS